MMDGTPTRIALVAVLVASLAACGGDDETGGDTTAASGVTTTVAGGPATTAGEDGATTTADPGQATTVEPGQATTVDPGQATTVAETTIEAVTTTVVGTAVGGNAGSEGRDQTDPNSELVRNADGSCSGWENSGTAGLENGAPVVFLDRDTEAPIGEGVVTSSAWADVDPSGEREQWNCTFQFEGVVTGTPAELYISVAGLPRWLARPDPTNPGAFVVSVDSQARIEVVESCSSPATSVASVDEWSAVGIYWSRGLDSMCNAGLTIAKIERTCRPPDFASEYIVAVTRADDPSIVLADAGGLRPEAAELVPGTPVIAQVTTGRPCG